MHRIAGPLAPVGKGAGSGAVGAQARPARGDRLTAAVTTPAAVVLAIGRGLWPVMTTAMFSWYKIKMFIEHAAIVTSDALHVLVGVALWVATGIVLRRPLTRWLPWLVVLVAAILNETVDLWVERWPLPAMQYGESAKDIMLTVLLPTLLMAAARSRPGLFAAAAGRRQRR